LITIVPLLTYIGVVIFIVGCIRKAYIFWKTPIHLRWELYPVAHERSKPYGGSYFEEIDWWTRSREKSRIGELITMGEEIFFLKGVLNHNKKMWYFSFPFHIGLYLLVAFAAFLLLGALGALLSLPAQLSELFHSLAVVAGVGGMLLTLAGGLGLFLRRVFVAALRNYSTPQDYFNLILILAIALTGFMGWITTDNFFLVLGEYVQGLIAFSPIGSISGISGWIIASIILFSFYLVYFPFTHMTHPIGKYFMYHEVRWNDEANVVGSKMVKEIEKVLNYKLSWSASHIKGEGKKRWVDVATEEVSPDEK